MSDTITTPVPSPEQAVTHGALAEVVASLEKRFAALETRVHTTSSEQSQGLANVHAQLSNEVAMVSAHAYALFASVSK